jgi:hypothetical protein
MDIIVYRNSDNSVVELIPSPEALSFATIQQIAEKDVPAGLEYKIVDNSTLPQDSEFRNAWEWNYESADGVGGESDQFPEEVLNGIG